MVVSSCCAGGEFGDRVQENRGQSILEDGRFDYQAMSEICKFFEDFFESKVKEGLAAWRYMWSYTGGTEVRSSGFSRAHQPIGGTDVRYVQDHE